jgi:hypothetical protein
MNTASATLANLALTSAMLAPFFMPARLAHATPIPEPDDAKLDDQCRKEMDALTAAIYKYRTSFAVSYLPSRMKLSEAGEYNLAKALDKDSVSFLARCRPRGTWKNNDWNGNGIIDPPDKGGDFILDGDQCLVFFLGGIGGTKGFSTSLQDPACRDEPRIGPFFKFPPTRLKPNGNTASKAGFLSFVDCYGKNFYAYFSEGPDGLYNTYGSSDCQALGVRPYLSQKKPTAAHWNPYSFQLLSAGRNGKFGNTTALREDLLWTPAKAQAVFPIGSDGCDDIANFHGVVLGK